VRVAITHYRSTRNDAKGTNLGEIGDQFIGHAIREVFIGGVA